MKKTQIIAISDNLNYIFTNEGVIKVSNKLNDLKGKNIIPYTYKNLDVAIDILKENILFRYKSGKITLDECLGEPRKFLYKLVEIFQPKNYFTLVSEWERKFGNDLLLINESVDKLIIERKLENTFNNFKLIIEQEGWGNYLYTGAENLAKFGQKQVDWVKKQGKELQQKGLVGYAKDKASAVFSAVANGIASAYNCVKSGIDCTMEGIRKILTSAVGVGVLTAASTIPVIGQVPTVVLFGGLLIWDLYKLVSGKGDIGTIMMDILVDVVSLLLPSLGKIIKTSFVGIKSFTQLGTTAASKGGVFLKVVNLLKSGLSKLQGFITNSAKFLGEKLGIKSLADWGTKASAKMAQLTDEAATAASGSKVATKSIKTTPTAKPSVKTLNPTEKTELDKLVANWKTQQTTLGKSTDLRTMPVTTKNQLIQQAKQNANPSLKQQVKQIWKTIPKGPIPATGEIVKTATNTFFVTAAMCAAMGVGISCREDIESGKISPEEIAAAEQKVQDQLSQSFEGFKMTGTL